MYCMFMVVCLVGCGDAGANVPANGSEPSHNVCSPVNYCPAPTCNSPLVGTWSEITEGAAFDFKANGAFGFADGACQGGGVFTCPGANNAGSLQMDILTSTNTSNCLSVGTYNCSYSIVGTAMVYGCGGTGLNFIRYN